MQTAERREDCGAPSLSPLLKDRTVSRMYLISAAVPALYLLFGPPCFAQTATPVPADVERRLPDACNVTVPKLIEAVCHDKGDLNTVAVNFPAICQQYKMTDKIEAALKSCDGKNIFYEMWKFEFKIDNKFTQDFSKYVKGMRQSEMDSKTDYSLTSSFEAFRLSVLACGLDADCHKSLFNALDGDVQAALEKTPYFCDYDPSVKSFDDASYKHMFFDDRYPGGIAQPMCRSYYCKYKECKDPAKANDMFILSDRFRIQYDLTYKVIQP